MSGRHLSILAIGISAMTGCGQPAPPPLKNAEPVGVQLLRVDPALKDQRFNALLTFESSTDAIFVSAAPSAGTLDTRGHTGQTAMMLPAGTQRAQVKLAALLGGKPFPGDWMLAGAYFFSESAVVVTVGYGLSDMPGSKRSVTLSPGRWTPVFVDLERAAVALQAWPESTSPSIHPLVFTFDGNSKVRVWCDDVAIVDNRQTLVGDPAAASIESGWSIERRGYRFVGNAVGRFHFELLTSEGSPQGWSVQETSELRARFASEGKSKSLTIYRDGRAYWDGEFKPMAKLGEWDEIFRAEHDAPGEIIVEDESIGRVERTTPGDVNHDGYNESFGAYEVSASGARLEVKIVPKSVALVRPVLEVVGLPEGKVLVTVEGRLVDGPVRLANGNVLIELPVRIDRPTIVNLRLQ